MDELNGESFFPRIVFKLKDYMPLPGDNAKEITRYFHQLPQVQWRQLFLSFPNIRINQLFCTLTNPEIVGLIDSAKKMDTAYTDPQLLSYFMLVSPDEQTSRKALLLLRAIPGVETAYQQGGLQNPSTITEQKRFTATHHNPAPKGIDTMYARRFIGGKGEGPTKLIDVEQGWVLDHESFKAGSLIYTGINVREFANHGTASLGVILMKKRRGMPGGIAPAANAFVVSQWRPGGTPNDADALLYAVHNLEYGDVLLLEIQSFHAHRGGAVWPVEIHSPVFDVIRLATTLGIIVIEAAGNGSLRNCLGNNLDEFTADDKQVLNPESTDFKDSGAILVAAARSAWPHTKTRASNYGNRINCYAWGEAVTTAGSYPRLPGGITNTYTPHFNGTSSASAIVAGAAIVVQSISEACYHTRLSAIQMRSLLGSEELNTASAGGKANDKIGVMPNLKKIIDEGFDKLNLQGVLLRVKNRIMNGN